MKFFLLMALLVMSSASQSQATGIVDVGGISNGPIQENNYCGSVTYETPSAPNAPPNLHNTRVCDAELFGCQVKLVNEIVSLSGASAVIIRYINFCRL